MPIMFFIFALSSSVFATENISQQTYTCLNKPFLLDRRLMSKVATVGTDSKTIDLTKVADLNNQNLKIEKTFEILKKQFISDLEKKFSKDEINYLNKIFSHSLIVRLIDFQNEFADSDKYNKLVQDTLKKNASLATK